MPPSDHHHGDEHAGHDHDHIHGDTGSTQTAQRVTALVDRLERAGVTSDAEIAGVLERFLAAAGPGNGARLVARAWTDAGFKTRLLNDANAAIAELGLDMTHWAPVRLVVVENHVAIGGLATLVIDALQEAGLARKLLKIAIPDQFIECGSLPYLQDRYGLTTPRIVERVAHWIA